MYEQEFENILARYPDLIESGLTLEGRQVAVGGKFIDLLFIDRHRVRLIVELKRGTVLRKDIGQLMDYAGELLFPDDPTVRVMLIGNRVPPNFGKSLDHYGIEWREFSYAFLTNFLSQKSDTEFLAYFSSEEVLPTIVTKSKNESKQQRTKISPGTSSKIWDKVRKVFGSDHSGRKLTRKQIIDMVEEAYPGTNRDSVMPSDYCYNIVNNGIAFTFHYFEYLRHAQRVSRNTKFWVKRSTMKVQYIGMEKL